MEKIKSICIMREMMKAIADLEHQLQSLHGVSLNEAMVLCCISSDTLTAKSISENTGLTPSNTSKVLRSVETKGLVTRSLGEVDRRQMHFRLTDAGLQSLQRLKEKNIEIPEFLNPLFKAH